MLFAFLIHYYTSLAVSSNNLSSAVQVALKMLLIVRGRSGGGIENPSFPPEDVAKEVYIEKVAIIDNTEILSDKMRIQIRGSNRVKLG